MPGVRLLPREREGVQARCWGRLGGKRILAGTAFGRRGLSRHGRKRGASPDGRRARDAKLHQGRAALA